MLFKDPFGFRKVVDDLVQPFAGRRVDAVAGIDYPRDKLQIQVLDDSTDDTVGIARDAVEQACAKGFDVEFIHRDDRTGYKAGALENGLKTASGEFITIFNVSQ